MLPAARAAYTPYKTGLRPQWSLAAGQSNRPAALAALPTATHKGAHCSGRPRSAAMVRISGLNSSMGGAASATPATHRRYCVVRTIWWGGRSFAAFAFGWPAGWGGFCSTAADAPHTASTTTPSAAKQTRIPQRFSTKPTKTVKNAPESPIAAPLTPVASPLRLAYHFWAQASTAGAKKALPTPAGMLYTKKNNAALPCGTSAAPMLPPPSSAVPHRAA